MSLVKVNVDEAIAILNKLEAEVETYRNHQKTAQKLAETIAEGWQGESGDAVQEMLTQWQKNQGATADKIAQNIQVLRNRLDDLVNADADLGGRISHSGGSGRRG